MSNPTISAIPTPRMCSRILSWADTDYTYLKRQSERQSGQWVAIDDDRNVAVGSVK